MAELTAEERQKIKLKIKLKTKKLEKQLEKQLEAKLKKRAARKEETQKMHEELYRLWCEYGGNSDKVALKTNYTIKTVKSIISSIRKKKKNRDD